jgi:hypothetical protein
MPCLRRLTLGIPSATQSITASRPLGKLGKPSGSPSHRSSCVKHQPCSQEPHQRRRYPRRGPLPPAGEPTPQLEHGRPTLCLQDRNRLPAEVSVSLRVAAASVRDAEHQGSSQA